MTMAPFIVQNIVKKEQPKVTAEFLTEEFHY